MKNNIKKAPVKFLEDGLYFQHFMLIFCLCPKSVIITTLTWQTKIAADNTLFFFYFYLSKEIRLDVSCESSEANLCVNSMSVYPFINNRLDHPQKWKVLYDI